MSHIPQKPDANAVQAEKVPAAETTGSAKEPPATPDLRERRKLIRPIPSGEVTESNDAETWAQFAGTTQSFFVKKPDSGS